MRLRHNLALLIALVMSALAANMATSGVALAGGIGGPPETHTGVFSSVSGDEYYPYDYNVGVYFWSENVPGTSDSQVVYSAGQYDGRTGDILGVNAFKTDKGVIVLQVRLKAGVTVMDRHFGRSLAGFGSETRYANVFTRRDGSVTLTAAIPPNRHLDFFSVQAYDRDIPGSYMGGGVGGGNLTSTGIFSSVPGTGYTYTPSNVFVMVYSEPAGDQSEIVYIAGESDGLTTDILSVKVTKNDYGVIVIRIDLKPGANVVAAQYGQSLAGFGSETRNAYVWHRYDGGDRVTVWLPATRHLDYLSLEAQDDSLPSFGPVG